MVFDVGDRESWSSQCGPFALGQPLTITRTVAIKFRKTAGPSANPEKGSLNFGERMRHVVFALVS
jgi:hypothetical protein